jgi:hypothetical protein
VETAVPELDDKCPRSTRWLLPVMILLCGYEQAELIPQSTRAGGSAAMGQSARTACGCGFGVQFWNEQKYEFLLMFSLVSEMAARIPKIPTFSPGDYVSLQCSFR